MGLSEADDRSSRRHLHILVASKTFSDLGSALDMVAINLYALILTNSELQMGLFMVIRVVGGFLFGSYIGYLADRMDRKKLMMIADLVRGIVLILLVISPMTWKIPLLYLASFLLGICNQMFSVSLQASIPIMVGKAQIIRANVWLTTWQSIAMVVGTIGAGVGIGLFGYELFFLIDAGTYLLSATVLFFLPIRTREDFSQSSDSLSSEHTFYQEMRDLLRTIWSLPILFGMLMLRFADSFGSASHNVGMPIYSQVLDPTRPGWYVGWIWGIWAIGNLIGSQGIARYLRKYQDRKLERIFVISTFGMSFFFILVFAQPIMPLLILAALLAGVSDGVSTVCFQLRLQSEPDHIRGKLFGLASTLHQVGFSGGMLLCSALFAFFTPFMVVLLLHGTPMLLACWYFRSFFGRKHYLAIRSLKETIEGKGTNKR
ncbi:MFS transporter [Risungbinella massiliensis]|uniref:MFS transporter n=1 Tax=Risungbinella massiliensis TaxID=1329796 RepID=UPI0005CBAE0A|nr:MFS transporter [Risungbinella massiliensis]